MAADGRFANFRLIDEGGLCRLGRRWLRLGFLSWLMPDVSRRRSLWERLVLRLIPVGRPRHTGVVGWFGFDRDFALGAICCWRASRGRVWALADGAVEVYALRGSCRFGCPSILRCVHTRQEVRFLGFCTAGAGRCIRGSSVFCSAVAVSCLSSEVVLSASSRVRSLRSGIRWS